jgi:hypothetical protein
MAGRDRRHVTQLAHPVHRLVVEIPDRVPREVASARAHQMCLLADPDLRLDRDPEQVGLELGYLHTASCLGQLLESRPLLPVRRNPLAGRRSRSRTPRPPACAPHRTSRRPTWFSVGVGRAGASSRVVALAGPRVQAWPACPLTRRANAALCGPRLIWAVRSADAAPASAFVGEPFLGTDRGTCQGRGRAQGKVGTELCGGGWIGRARANVIASPNRSWPTTLI